MPAPRITPKALLDLAMHEKVHVLDVRQGESFESSSEMLPGSVRLDPNDDATILAHAGGLDRQDAVVTYCT